MSEVDVRRISEVDLPVVIERLPSRPAVQHRRRWERQERGGYAFLIAWIGEVPVGFVGVGLLGDGAPDVLAESRGLALVSDLSVEEPFRRRGAGRALMLALEEEARAAGLPGVLLDTGTDESFAAARELYRSLEYDNQGGVYLGGWSDPERPGLHIVDPLTQWRKDF